MVEMALVLPVLALLMVGLVEFSRVLMVQQVITNAAREGARAGALYFNDDDAIEHATNVSQTYIQASGVDPAPAVMNPSITMTSGIPAFQMQVSYTFNTLLNGFLPVIPATLQMSSVATMRREL